MGFENRKHSRVKAEFNICFWPAGEGQGPPSWGHVANFSESGLAFHSAQALPKGESVLVEFSPSAKEQPMRLFAQVVYCEREDAPERRYQMRIHFLNLQVEERQLLRHFVLQVADPKLAAALGWGRALFGGLPAIACSYRELQAHELRHWMDSKAYFSAKELGFLKKYQAHLEAALGSRSPSNFRLLGSKPLKVHSVAWFELELGGHRLHLLGETLWCSEEQATKFEAGLSVVAYHKDEAIKAEKGG
jgi:hypothetical protein